MASQAIPTARVDCPLSVVMVNPLIFLMRTGHPKKLPMSLRAASLRHDDSNIKRDFGADASIFSIRSSR